MLRVAIGILIATIAMVSGSVAYPQNSNANPHAFGLGQPARVQDLPPGQLRKSLESLPPGQQRKALNWLQGFEFPREDLDSIFVNSDGSVYYADYGLARAWEGAGAAGPGDDAFVGEALPDGQLFTLHSKPGSANTLFLDFDGHVIEDTQWNLNPTYGTGINPHPALPFDPSTNDSPAMVANFTDDERRRIHEIWHRMAEDFAPFDIDVTTEEPASFDRYTGHVLFTHDTDANGNAMPAQGAGGVAWINVFGNSNYVASYSPALVYYTNLYTNNHGFASLNAEAGSHEFGHNVGLGHDGVIGGAEYYGGHGSGNVRWGPIMGGSYNDHVTQWSKGEYTSANNTEDDIARIAGDMSLAGNGFDPDREGDSSATATPLTVLGNGDIVVVNTETDDDIYNDPSDPGGPVPGENKGIIQDETDEDWWYLDVGAGAMNIVVTPAWHAFNYAPYTTINHRGANLDIDLELYDSTLALVDFDEPTTDTDAGVSATVAAGRYYLRIRGTGNVDNGHPDGYSAYASIGMYFIEGTSAPASADTDPPTPDPMSWSTPPNATGPGSMNMVATTATDPSGVEYDFTCVAGGAGCTNSGWQSSPTYDATGLASNTFYSWRVRARDGFNNITGDSATLGDTTDLAPPATPTGFNASTVSTSQIDLGWNDNADETGYTLEWSADGGAPWNLLANLPADTTSASHTGLDTAEDYYYRLSADNAAGSSAYATDSATTFDLPPLAPSDLQVTGVTENSISLSWTDNSGNESSFVIERSADGLGWAEHDSVGANTTNWTDIGLPPLETWHYRVLARNAFGDSATSNAVNATTDAECSETLALAAGAWQLFALPCAPAPGSDTVDDLFSGLDPADLGGAWQLYALSGLNNATPLGIDSVMTAGVAYFSFTGSAGTVSVDGTNLTQVDSPLAPGAGTTPNLVPYSGSGSQAWSATVPRENSKNKNWNWADVFDNPSGTYNCDMDPVGNKCRIHRVLFKWNGGGFDSFDLDGPAAGMLEPWDVMLVRAYRNNLQLRVPAAAAGQPAAAPPAKPGKGGDKDKGGKGGKEKAWHLRLSAESGNLKDRHNYLGALDDSQDGLDGRDLEELAPFAFPYMSLTFDNPDFGDAAWGHATDFRAPAATAAGEWSFRVRGAGLSSDVTLRWQGPAELLDKAVLVDEQTGEVITAEAGGSYTFTMDGDGESRFRFILSP